MNAPALLHDSMLEARPTETCFQSVGVLNVFDQRKPHEQEADIMQSLGNIGGRLLYVCEIHDATIKRLQTNGLKVHYEHQANDAVYNTSVGQAFVWQGLDVKPQETRPLMRRNYMGDRKYGRSALMVVQVDGFTICGTHLLHPLQGGVFGESGNLAAQLAQLPPALIVGDTNRSPDLFLREQPIREQSAREAVRAAEWRHRFAVAAIRKVSALGYGKLHRSLQEVGYDVISNPFDQHTWEAAPDDTSGLESYARRQSVQTAPDQIYAHDELRDTFKVTVQGRLAHSDHRMLLAEVTHQDLLRF